MEKNLFKNVNHQTDPHWIAKQFFNSMYQQDRFLWALPLMVERTGCCVNEEFCFFPDLNDPDPVYHFSGVNFGTFDDEIIITDEQYNSYLIEACARYVEENPADKKKVNAILGGNAT